MLANPRSSAVIVSLQNNGIVMIFLSPLFKQLDGYNFSSLELSLTITPPFIYLAYNIKKCLIYAVPQRNIKPPLLQ
jgi:hypothetical protein